MIFPLLTRYRHLACVSEQNAIVGARAYGGAQNLTELTIQKVEATLSLHTTLVVRYKDRIKMADYYQTLDSV